MVYLNTNHDQHDWRLYRCADHDALTDSRSGYFVVPGGTWEQNRIYSVYLIGGDHGLIATTTPVVITLPAPEGAEAISPRREPWERRLENH